MKSARKHHALLDTFSPDGVWYPTGISQTDNLTQHEDKYQTLYRHR